jgi:hypothetical protein
MWATWQPLAAGCPKIGASKVIDLGGVIYPGSIGQ